MYDPKIFRHLIKFYHPFSTIVNKYILWNPKLVDLFIFQKFDNNFNSMFFYGLCLTPLKVMIYSN